MYYTLPPCREAKGLCSLKSTSEGEDYTDGKFISFALRGAQCLDLGSDRVDVAGDRCVIKGKDTRIARTRARGRREGRRAGGVISVGITGSRLDGSRERLHCLLNWLGQCRPRSPSLLGMTSSLASNSNIGRWWSGLWWISHFRPEMSCTTPTDKGWKEGGGAAHRRISLKSQY